MVIFVLVESEPLVLIISYPFFLDKSGKFELYVFFLRVLLFFMFCTFFTVFSPTCFSVAVPAAISLRASDYGTVFITFFFPWSSG